MLLFEQIYHLDQHVNLENKEKKLIATKGYIYNVKNINFIHISFLSSPSTIFYLKIHYTSFTRLPLNTQIKSFYRSKRFVVKRNRSEDRYKARSKRGG